MTAENYGRTALAVADYIQSRIANGDAVPMNYRTIAKGAGVSVRSVARCVPSLVRRRAFQRRNTGGGGAIYRLPRSKSDLGKSIRQIVVETAVGLPVDDWTPVSISGLARQSARGRSALDREFREFERRGLVERRSSGPRRVSAYRPGPVLLDLRAKAGLVA